MNHLAMAEAIIGAGDAKLTSRRVHSLMKQLEGSYGQLVFDPQHAPALIRRLLTDGMRSHADRILEAATRLAEQNPSVASWAGSASHSAGLVRQDAEEILRGSAQFADARRPLAAAWAKADAARVLARHGSPDAHQLADQAGQRLRELGAFAAAEQLVTETSSTGGRPRKPLAPRPATGWDALTPAELRVVRFAADGATNKEIANALWISPYTVDTHMRHILAKLGVRSRVALARLAAQRETENPAETQSSATEGPA
jgi:DNA-binding CsgD family transcriptional regulator